MKRSLLLLLLLLLPGLDPIRAAHADQPPKGYILRHNAESNTPQASAPASSKRRVTLPPGDPLGYRPAEFPKIPGGASYYRIFDPPLTRVTLFAATTWNGAPKDFVIPSTALSRWNGTPPPPPGLPPGMDTPDKPERPHPEPPSPPNKTDVPGPASILGVIAAFAWSRRLRRRIKG